MSHGLRRRALGIDFSVSSDLDGDLDSYFATFDAQESSAASRPETSLRVQRADDDFFELSIDGATVFRTLDLGVLLHQTVWEITRRAVGSVPGDVVLHAGVVEIAGTRIAMSGPSGAGKSTLTAALVARGATYLTDEAVVVEDDGGLGDAIRRPIQLSATSIATLGLDEAVSLRLPDGSGYLAIESDGEDGDDVPVADHAAVVVTLEGHGGPIEIRRTPRSDLAAWLLRESFAGQALSQSRLDSIKELSMRCLHLALRGGSVAERANTVLNVLQKP